MKNIVLIGFMGTGKTSIGKALSVKIGYAFVDIDQKIEAEENMTIPEIFAMYGEAYFRELEENTVELLSQRKNTVIATGGGTVKNPRNMEMLRSRGFVISLKADIDVILERTSKPGLRPLLDAATDRKAVIEKLLAERKHLYEKADYTVDTSENSPLLIVDDIARHLRTRGALRG